ncbi:MAG: hypothetical protein Q7J78_04150 [Clostridiales bacterium]|nr:hypothetical protein [Clostridiales bacterium]
MKTELSKEHINAVNRRRRIIINYDTCCTFQHFKGDLGKLFDQYTYFLDDKGSQVDAIFWNWTDGNIAVYPSKYLPVVSEMEDCVDRLFDGIEEINEGYPLTDQDKQKALTIIKAYKEWWNNGIIPMKVFLEETKKRGLEAFFSYRINGATNDFGPLIKSVILQSHPDWGLPVPYNNGALNFKEQGVRDLKLNILKEVAENFDYDGIELDFARCPPFLPPGHQWENRDILTDFVRSVRIMLLEVEKKRGRPFLLAARIAENIEGNHFDGLDVETWMEESLIDIFVLGNRSFEVDIQGFRYAAKDKDIKFYPCYDTHHAPDGYMEPPIEIYRGAAANWLKQGADGICAFNFRNIKGIYKNVGSQLLPERQVYLEAGSLDTLMYKEKIFVVQRRGGGHGAEVVPNAEDWTTPRLLYANTNMLSQLPVKLQTDGKADTMLEIYAADNVKAYADKVEKIYLRLLLSQSSAEGMPDERRLEKVLVARIGHANNRLYNIPPVSGIEEHIEIRLNNILLYKATVDKGWLIYEVQPKQLATGNNLIGIRIIEQQTDMSDEITIEKLEIHVKYNAC